MKKPTSAPTLGRSAKPDDALSYERRLAQRGDLVLMTMLYRGYKARLDEGNSLSLEEQSLLVELLLSVADNPDNATVALGLSKDTRIKYRDCFIATYILRLMMRDKKINKHGGLEAAFQKVSEQTGLARGAVKGIYYRAMDCTMEDDAYKGKPKREVEAEIWASLHEATDFPMNAYPEIIKHRF